MKSKLMMISIIAIILVASLIVTGIYIIPNFNENINQDIDNDNNYPDNNNTDNNTNIINITNNNITKNIEFEEIDVNYFQIGWQLNQSIPDQDVALFLPNWEVFNSSFDSHLSKFQPDFVNYSYVFVYWELKFSSGYNVNITKLHFDNGSLTVFVDESNPNDGDGLIWVCTKPIDIVQIPITEMENITVNNTLYEVNTVFNN